MILDLVLKPDPVYQDSTISHHTSSAAASQTVHTYAMSVGIMSVCRKLYTEAWSMLLKQNTLVKVTLNWPGIESKRELWGIPALQIFQRPPGWPSCETHSVEATFITAKQDTRSWQQEQTLDLGATPLRNSLEPNGISAPCYLLLWDDFVRLLEVLSLDMDFWLMSSAQIGIRTQPVERNRVHQPLTKVWPKLQEAMTRLVGCQSVEYYALPISLESVQAGVPHNSLVQREFPSPGSLAWLQYKEQMASRLKTDTDEIMMMVGKGTPNPKVLDGLRMRYEGITRLCYGSLDHHPMVNYSLETPPEINDKRRTVLRTLGIAYDSCLSAVLLEIKTWRVDHLFTDDEAEVVSRLLRMKTGYRRSMVDFRDG